MMKESLAKNGLMLGAFAVVTTALIALTFFLAPKIKLSNKSSKNC